MDMLASRVAILGLCVAVVTILGCSGGRVAQPIPERLLESEFSAAPHGAPGLSMWRANSRRDFIVRVLVDCERLAGRRSGRFALCANSPVQVELLRCAAADETLHRPVCFEGLEPIESWHAVEGSVDFELAEGVVADREGARSIASVVGANLVFANERGWIRLDRIAFDDVDVTLAPQ